MSNYQAAGEPVWPYIGVVSCLFALSIVAARSWQEAPSWPTVQHTTYESAKRVDRRRSDLWLEPNGGFATRAFSQPTLRISHLSEPATVPVNASLGAGQRSAEPVEQRVAKPAVQTQLIGSGEEAILTDPIRQILVSQIAKFAPRVGGQVEARERDTPTLPSNPVSTTTDPSTITGEEADSETSERVPVATVPEEARKADSDWPEPTALTQLIRELRLDPTTQVWASKVAAALHRFDSVSALSSTDADDIVQRLSALSTEATELARTIDEHEARTALFRAGYAIRRRMSIWQQVHRIATDPTNRVVSVGIYDLEDLLDRVEEGLGTGEVGGGWRKYLKLSALQSANRTGDPEVQRRLARRVLERLRANEWLSDDQRSFLAKPLFDEFAEALERWSREPVSLTRLLDALERYENKRNAAAGSELARAFQIARWSRKAELVDLAESIDTHYRNANLRVAVSAELINLLLPQPQIAEEEVHENILGAHVYGTSRTDSNLKVILIPDRHLWRMRLVARGAINSSTAASKGPATFYNDGYSKFRASKKLLVDRKGVKVELAEAEAATASTLTGFHTQYDSIPLVGLLVRAIARQQHDDQYYDAQIAVGARLKVRAQERLDEEVHLQLDEIKDDFQEKILGPLNALSLRPKALDMQTTDQRLVIRYRLAGRSQLGGHTPRPQAPSDSMLSVQIHETAINNVIGQLNLNGREEGLREMYARLATQFQHDEVDVPEEIPEGVKIRFAQREALRLRLDDNRVTITVRISELATRHRKWRNFAVRVYYVPDPTQLEANLVRDGVVELAGSKLRLGDQIALRGIFSKVFSKNRPVNIINKQLARHPKMRDLQVTQFTIENGWIGIALGPQRGTNIHPEVARRANTSP